jgi:hypothetical protein
VESLHSGNSTYGVAKIVHEETKANRDKAEKLVEGGRNPRSVVENKQTKSEKSCVSTMYVPVMEKMV